MRSQGYRGIGVSGYRVTRKGFTLIEIITAIVLISLIMIPISIMAIEYVRSITYAQTITQAMNLANRELAVVNNTNYNEVVTGFFPNYNGTAFDLRRNVTLVAALGNMAKQVTVTLYPQGSSEKIAESVSYIANVSFGVGGGRRSASFAASGGTMPRGSNRLYNITLRNQSTTNTITMIGVLIKSDTPNGRARTITFVTMDGVNRYSGSFVLTDEVETQVPFQDNFAMPPSSRYSGVQGGIFTFEDNSIRNDRITIMFIFSDGSKSSYSWRTS